MRIALIIPTRGDRKNFILQAKRMIHRQTLQPDEIFFMDYPPIEGRKDITERYRKGVKLCVSKSIDFALFWEDDDWYADDYIETMFNSWIFEGQPGLIGIEETYYYHLAIKSYWYQYHKGRASAFSTGLAPRKIQNETWPADTDPWTDLWIWQHWKCNKRFLNFRSLGSIKTIGIKHGVGLVGGMGHDYSKIKWTQDNAAPWFFGNVGKEDFNTYEKIAATLKK